MFVPGAKKAARAHPPALAAVAKSPWASINDMLIQNRCWLCEQTFQKGKQKKVFQVSNIVDYFDEVFRTTQKAAEGGAVVYAAVTGSAMEMASDSSVNVRYGTVSYGTVGESSTNGSEGDKPSEAAVEAAAEAAEAASETAAEPAAEAAVFTATASAIASVSTAVESNGSSSSVSEDKVTSAAASTAVESSGSSTGSSSEGKETSAASRPQLLPSRPTFMSRNLDACFRNYCDLMETGGGNIALATIFKENEIEMWMSGLVCNTSLQCNAELSLFLSTVARREGNISFTDAVDHSLQAMKADANCPPDCGCDAPWSFLQK
jgi:hypothetical protein